MAAGSRPSTFRTGPNKDNSKAKNKLRTRPAHLMPMKVTKVPQRKVTPALGSPRSLVDKKAPMPSKTSKKSKSSNKKKTKNTARKYLFEKGR